MNAFDYLSVITSIILGLSLTQLLTGLGRMIQVRARLRFYWPLLLAIIALVLADLQFWWSLFGQRERADWDFAGFLVILSQAIVLSVASTVLVPAMPEEAAEIDLKRAYFDHARWYYGLMLAVLGVSLVKNLVLEGHLPRPADLGAHAVFAVVFAVAAVSRSDRVHKVLTPAALLLFAAYIATLFAQLGS